MLCNDPDGKNTLEFQPVTAEHARRRRRHRRRRVRRAVHAPPAAPARPLGAGLRGGRRRRRHVVLEPLPGRPLRRREHGLLLLVLGRARSRSGSGPSATPPSRRSCATSTTSPTASTCGATSSFDTRVTAADLRRGDEPLDGRHRSRRPRLGAVLHHGHRLPVDRADAGVPGPRDFRGHAGTTPGSWPHEGVDFTGQRVGVIGTGSSAIQSIPLIAEQAAHLFVFQRTPNFSVPARNAPLDPELRAQVKANYAEFRRQARESRVGFVGRAQRRLRPGGVRPRSGSASTRRAGSAAASASSRAFNDLLTNQDANDTAAEFFRDKIRAIVRDPASPRCWRRRTIRSAPSASCVDTGYYETFNRDNVTLVDHPARADRGDHARGRAHAGRRRTSWTASCSPPASTP